MTLEQALELARLVNSDQFRHIRADYVQAIRLLLEHIEDLEAELRELPERN